MTPSHGWGILRSHVWGHAVVPCLGPRSGPMFGATQWSHAWGHAVVPCLGPRSKLWSTQILHFFHFQYPSLTKFKNQSWPKIAPRIAFKIHQNREAMIIFSTWVWKTIDQNYPMEGVGSNSKSHVAPGLNEKSKIWTYFKRDFLRFFRDFNRSWNFWAASRKFYSRHKFFNEFYKIVIKFHQILCFDQPRDGLRNWTPRFGSTHRKRCWFWYSPIAHFQRRKRTFLLWS